MLRSVFERFCRELSCWCWLSFSYAFRPVKIWKSVLVRSAAFRSITHHTCLWKHTFLQSLGQTCPMLCCLDVEFDADTEYRTLRVFSCTFLSPPLLGHPHSNSIRSHLTQVSSSSWSNQTPYDQTTFRSLEITRRIRKGRKITDGTKIHRKRPMMDKGIVAYGFDDWSQSKRHTNYHIALLRSFAHYISSALNIHNCVCVPIWCFSFILG